jgi:hypothetical protein
MLVEAAATTGSGSERLAHFIRAYTAFLCSHPNFARIVQQEMLTGGRLFREVFLPQTSSNYSILRGIIDDGVSTGEFRPVDVDLAPLSLIGMMAFFLLARPVIEGMLGIGPEGEGFAERLSAHTANLILRGLTNPDAPDAARDYD